MTDLIRRFPQIPSFQSIWDDDDEWSITPMNSGGLSISEDDKNVYVEAAVPGIDPKNIDVTFDKGTLWVKGEQKDEQQTGQKFYRRAASSFSYRVVVPGEIDPNVEYKATHKNGMVKVSFAKLPSSQPRKIEIKAE